MLIIIVVFCKLIRSVKEKKLQLRVIDDLLITMKEEYLIDQNILFLGVGKHNRH